jgi:hypothetical protein
VLELVITLKSNKVFEELTNALVSFITNTQIVDPKFIINPINPLSKDKNICSKGEVLPNMTKLGTHIKISGSCNIFNKHKVWGTQTSNVRSNRKVKKEKFCNPTVYFSMVVSTEVNPHELINCTSYEWACLNGTQLQVKDLKFIDSKTVVTFFKLSTSTPKAVILSKLKKILHNDAQVKACEDNLYFKLYDFSLDLNIPRGNYSWQ